MLWTLASITTIQRTIAARSVLATSAGSTTKSSFVPLLVSSSSSSPSPSVSSTKEDSKSTGTVHRSRCCSRFGRHRGRRRDLTPFVLFFAAGTVLFPSVGTTARAFSASSSGGGWWYGYGNDMATTERLGDGTITVTPKNEADQSALVVISHGLGDSAEGFADVAELFSREMPHVKFILPTAPTQPVTMNMGMSMPSWYDIVGLDERSNENCKGIEDSRARIASILQKEHEETKLPYSRMVLAGFSQGGALSLFTALQLPEDQKLAALVIMSGYLPAASKFKVTSGMEDVPILHCHGTQDPVVAYHMATKSRDHVVNGCGCTNYTIREYPIGHTVSMDELEHVKEFLKSAIPHDDAYRIQLKDPSTMSVKELRAAVRKAGLSHKAVGLMEKSEFVKLLQDHRNGKL